MGLLALLIGQQDNRYSNMVRTITRTVKCVVPVYGSSGQNGWNLRMIYTYKSIIGYFILRV